MKTEKFTLINQFVLDNVMISLRNKELNGRVQVTISDTASKSARQRGLQWLWNTEVANSGKGGKHEDTKEGVHLVSKYRWCIPILIRDDPNFADLYLIWKQLYGGDEERMLWFTQTQVHTEKLSASQMAEFLTEYQRHYSSQGIELTNPDDMGLLQQ